MPRWSKNGTPEERAAKAAGGEVRSSHAEPASDRIDRRKLRGSPLREKVGPISFAVTVVGKMYTADLREEPLDLEEAAREGWLQTLHTGSAAARFVADELDKAADRLKVDRIMAKHDLLSPELQRIVHEEVDRMLEERQP